LRFHQSVSNALADHSSGSSRKARQEVERTSGFICKPADDRGFDTGVLDAQHFRLREGDAFPGCRPRTHFSAEKRLSRETGPLTRAVLAESDDLRTYDEPASVLRNSAIQIAVLEFTALADELFTVP
jgi:hypothetical protein